jgi:hypothetical protein
MSFPGATKVYNKSMKTYTHRHHQLPQKAPYLPELHQFKEEWTVDLTIEGHACQHEILYKVFGWEGDKLASDGLNKTDPELHKKKAALGGKNGSKIRKERGHYGLGHCHVISVTATNKKTGEERTFPSLKCAADELGLHASHVSACWRGLRKSTGGWTFKEAP